MEDFQTLFDNFALAAKTEALQDKPIITLGELIAKLEGKDPKANLAVQFLDKLRGVDGVDSYRGYYSDLAIEPGSMVLGTVAEGLEVLRNAVGSTFEGYKGGEYRMNNRTLVWVDTYGSCTEQGVTGVEVMNGLVVITSADCGS
jgi:hypothetical protein